MESNTEDQEASRSRRTILLMVSGALLLILPLLGIAYMRMKDTTRSGTPGTNLMNTFERRIDPRTAPLPPTPLASSPAGDMQASMTKPADGVAGAASTSAFLGYITGGQEYQQMAKQQPEVPSAGQAVDHGPTPDSGQPQQPAAQQPAVPQPAVPQPVVQQPVAQPVQQAQGRTLAPPKLGTTQSRLKPTQWGMGAKAAAGTTAPQAPAGAAPPGGMPPGMDPAAMMKMMGGGAGGAPGGAPGGMDPAAMMKMMGGGAGGAPGGAPPGGMDPSAMMKMMGGMGGAAQPGQAGTAVPSPSTTKKQ
ncbi:MAG: hypothetical protein HY927_01685 [Elusimicrobia bacterium]|nr:hypothetical protein [Elusimicrobiota bacterium]